MHLVGIIYLKSHYVPIHHIVEGFLEFVIRCQWSAMYVFEDT